MATTVQRIDKIIGTYDDEAETVNTVFFTTLSDAPGIAVLQASVAEGQDTKAQLNEQLEDITVDTIP